MSSNIHWNPRLADHEIMGNALKKLKKVGEVIAEEVRKNTPVGTVSRPIYRKGPYKGKYWTSRDAGSLKKSVRVVKKEGSTNRDVRVIVGHRKAYYGKIIEYDKPFFRPAVNRGKRKARMVLTRK